MSSKSNLHLVNFIDQFTPEILGAIWITEEDLGSDLIGFDELNYLFDGLISQYLYGKAGIDEDKHLERPNTFFTSNFKLKLCLVHVKIQNIQAGLLDDQMVLFNETDTESTRNKILIINSTSSSHWGTDLQKRYPQFQFIDLILNKN